MIQSIKVGKVSWYSHVTTPLHQLHHHHHPLHDTEDTNRGNRQTCSRDEYHSADSADRRVLRVCSRLQPMHVHNSNQQQEESPPPPPPPPPPSADPSQPRSQHTCSRKQHAHSSPSSRRQRSGPVHGPRRIFDSTSDVLCRQKAATITGGGSRGGCALGCRFMRFWCCFRSLG